MCKKLLLFCFQGELIWFDPGVGHALPGEVLEYHKPAQVLTVQAVIAGKVRNLNFEPNMLLVVQTSLELQFLFYKKSIDRETKIFDSLIFID